MRQETRIFSGLRWFFAVCFGIAVLCVVTAAYPLAGVILFLAGLLVIVSRYDVSRGGGQILTADSALCCSCSLW